MVKKKIKNVNKNYNINILENDTWKFRPTTNKYGEAKYKYDTKYIIKATSNIFDDNVIITSDLHSHSFELFSRLAETNIVLKIKPILYIYGHCHHQKIHSIHNNIHFLNVDGRVIIMDKY